MTKPATKTPRRATTTKAEQSRRTRELIVKTGMKCIAKYGYVGTSMNLISKEAKISRGPLHYHFSSKYELMGAIAEALPRQASRKTIRRLEGAASIDERLSVFIDIAIEQHLDDHHLIAIDLLSVARRDKELASAVLPHFTESEHLVDAWWLEYARELGWSDDKMRSFRTVFLAALRGLALDYSAQIDRVAHAKAADLLREMVSSFLSSGKH